MLYDQSQFFRIFQLSHPQVCNLFSYLEFINLYLENITISGLGPNHSGNIFVISTFRSQLNGVSSGEVSEPGHGNYNRSETEEGTVRGT